MFERSTKAILASAAVMVALCQLSTPALAGLEIDPKWPTVKCKKDGKRFAYQLNGAPSYASAAARCAAHGEVDSEPPIVRGRPILIKKSIKAIENIPTRPGCGAPSGIQNQNTC